MIRWLMLCLMIVLVACAHQTEPDATYITPIDIPLYPCIEQGCQPNMIIPAQTTVTIKDKIIQETRIQGHVNEWWAVRYGEIAGFIGRWESNAQYAFDKVRSCAGYDCPIIDMIDYETVILLLDVETIDVIQWWQRIIYDGDKVGFVGPKMPGPSKSSQMIAEATQMALTTTP